MSGAGDGDWEQADNELLRLSLSFARHHATYIRLTPMDTL